MQAQGTYLHMESEHAMTTQTLSQPHQSTSPPGAWKLAPGRALTLQPREAGVFRVALGRMWVTLDGPHQGPANDLGDHVFDAGARLHLRAGQRLVIEAWDARTPAYFSWDSLRALAPISVPQSVGVRQSAADLSWALHLAAAATGALAAALAKAIADRVWIRKMASAQAIRP